MHQTKEDSLNSTIELRKELKAYATNDRIKALEGAVESQCKELKKLHKAILTIQNATVGDDSKKEVIKRIV